MNYNNSKEKCRLRRQQLLNNQRNAQFNGKKSLSKRIIEQRTSSLTKNNVNRELDELAFRIKIDEMFAQVAYHIRFYTETRPSTSKEKVEEWVRNIRDLQRQLSAKQIDAKQYFECLESLDKEVVALIDNWSQCR